MILTKYKNNLLTIIQEYGLDPNLFIAADKTINDTDYFTISLHDAEIHFAIQPYYSSFERFVTRYSEFRANYPLCDRSIANDWNSLAARFKSWLGEVVKPYLDNISTPNLWHILEETRSRTKYELGTPEDFEAFSDEEKTQIRLSLNDFRLLIVENFNPNQEELKSVDARLEYLSDAIDKHNKFDWKGIAIATVINITIALSLNPEQGSQLFQLFKQIFSNVLYLLP